MRVILLLADEAEGGPAKRDLEIADVLGCGRATVERVRIQFVEEGIEATLNPKPATRTYERRRNGKGGAYLVALVCGAPPEGRGRWALRLLADHMVGLESYSVSCAHRARIFFPSKGSGQAMIVQSDKRPEHLLAECRHAPSTGVKNLGSQAADVKTLQ